MAEAEADESRWFIDRTVNDAVITAMSGTHGPVHINVEIDSPLNREVSGEESYRIIRRAASRMSLSDEARNEISRRMLACRKVLVLGGVYGDRTTGSTVG